MRGNGQRGFGAGGGVIPGAGEFGAGGGTGGAGGRIGDRGSGAGGLAGGSGVIEGGPEGFGAGGLLGGAADGGSAPPGFGAGGFKAGGGTNVGVFGSAAGWSGLDVTRTTCGAVGEVVEVQADAPTSTTRSIWRWR